MNISGIEAGLAAEVNPKSGQSVKDPTSVTAATSAANFSQRNLKPALMHKRVASYGAGAALRQSIKTFQDPKYKTGFQMPALLVTNEYKHSSLSGQLEMPHVSSRIESNKGSTFFNKALFSNHHGL